MIRYQDQVIIDAIILANPTKIAKTISRESFHEKSGACHGGISSTFGSSSEVLFLGDLFNQPKMQLESSLRWYAMSKHRSYPAINKLMRVVLSDLIDYHIQSQGQLYPSDYVKQLKDITQHFRSSSKPLPKKLVIESDFPGSSRQLHDIVYQMQQGLYSFSGQRIPARIIESQFRPSQSPSVLKSIFLRRLGVIDCYKPGEQDFTKAC